MKRIIAAVINIIIFFSVVSYAQETTCSIGPYLALKGGISGVNTPSGRENGFSFNGIPDIGATIHFPLDSIVDLGLGFNLGYSKYSYYIFESDGNGEFQHNYSYLTFGPNVTIDFLFMGFNFGFPLAADIETEINTDKLGFLAEIQLGAALPVYTDETGEMNMFFRIGYMLTGIYDSFSKDDPLINIIPVQPPQNLADKYNPRVLSFALGFNYLFNL